MALLAEILINRPAKQLDRTFTYRIPEKFSGISSGWRCVVPFRGKTEEGIVISIYQKEEQSLGYRISEMIALVEDFPWFTQEMLALARWISMYYLCTYLDALRLFLIDKKGIKTQSVYYIDWNSIPANHLIRGLLADSVIELLEPDAEAVLGAELLKKSLTAGWLEKKDSPEAVYHPPLERWLSLNGSAEKASIRGKKQAALWDFLCQNGSVSLSLLENLGFSSSVIRDFCRNGRGSIFYKEKEPFSLVRNIHEEHTRVLTEEQQKACRQIAAAIDKKNYEGFLLMGVTGSGKTEVYLRSAEHVRKEGGMVLILVPEIALTIQMTAYFSARFGDDVVFFHSKLSKGERYNNRTRIAQGKSHIVIGSRSALFMPYKDLRLIIVDEEYDTSYKQDETPRYNGRDAAKKLAVLHQSTIVLGAATPSIVTYAAAEAGQIRLIEMKERVHHTPLPKIYTVDLKLPLNMVEGSMYSKELLYRVRKTAEAGDKAILFLNRRGFSTALICKDCGYVFKCPNCDVSLVHHWSAEKLKCHYCECVFPLPERCPKCGGCHISYTGQGTEKAEEQLKTLLPNISCVRLDLDSTSRKYAAEQILADFRQGKYQVLLGTQMVTKGHDIPGVQMVGILTVDSIMNRPTYLAAEQAYILITQCAGRAGRSTVRGEVILQTYDPGHYVIQAARQQDYGRFYQQEIEFRRALHYPPFVRMMKVTCFSKIYREAKAQAAEISSWLQDMISHMGDKVEATAPYDEPICKVRNTYYISIMIKGKSLLALKTAMRQSTIFLRNGILIDMDPLS